MREESYVEQKLRGGGWRFWFGFQWAGWKYRLRDWWCWLRNEPAWFWTPAEGTVMRYARSGREVPDNERCANCETYGDVRSPEADYAICWDCLRVALIEQGLVPPLCDACDKPAPDYNSTAQGEHFCVACWEEQDQLPISFH